MNNNHNEPTEESALLHDIGPLTLPLVHPATLQLDSLSEHELGQIHNSDVLWPSELSSHRPIRVAFALVVLLTLRDRKFHNKSSLPNPWEQWSHETATQKQLSLINECITEVWVHSFLSAYCSSSRGCRGTIQPSCVLDSSTPNPMSSNSNMATFVALQPAQRS